MSRISSRFVATHLCRFCVIVLFAVSLLGNSATAQSERPPAEKLLPETTVAFFAIPNIRDLYEKVMRSNGGKLLQHESIAPLAADIYQQGLDAYEEFVKIGLSVEEIQSLPAGEITIAMIAPKRKDPVFLFLIETDPENEAVSKALNVGRDFAEKEGAEFETEEGEEVTFESVIAEGNRVTYFQRDGMIVASNSQDELDDLLDRWAGREVEKIRPLSENRKFVTIMNRCRGSEKYPPDIKFYVDPIELARSAFRGEMQAQVAINFLPILGLDGLLAVGGSSTMFVDEFESISHGHVLLANPRKGVLEALALKPGDYRPEAWVPEDATTYYTTSIDIRKMMVEIEKIVDLIAGEGKFREGLENNVNAELGLDVEEDVINSLTGRATLFTWMEPPARFTSQVFAVGIELENVDKAKEVMEVLLDKFEEEEPEDFEKLEERNYKGFSFWTVSDEEIEKNKERMNERQRERREQRGDDRDMEVDFDVNQPQFCWGIIEDHLILSGSPQLVELMIDTQRGEHPNLAENELFKTTTRKMSNLLGTDMPAFMIYSEPRETIRALLESARLENTGQYFDLADGNKYAEGIRSAMENNPLPQFDEIEQFFQPSGMFITDDESGYHMLAFQLGAEEEASTGKK